MSQLSQFSEGGFSDIIPDVENFIVENGIVEDVGHLLGGVQNGHVAANDSEEEQEYKSVLVDSFGTIEHPPLFQIVEEVLCPPDQPVNLGTEEYSGPFNFEVLIIPSEQKTPWEYSTKLNKIFIGINLKFPVAFSLKHHPKNLNLYVRATPIFSQSQYFQEFVHRCVGHQHPQDPSNKGLAAHVFQHIMRCSNDNTQYLGDKNKGTRPNVVIPLGKPQAGSDVIKEFYHFVCKNSCPLGMNRRSTDIVFTLENESGELFGRRLVSVRICSCPKRDKEKEEKDMDKNCNPPQGKKRKLGNGGGSGGRRDGNDGNVDTKLYSLNVNIVGKNNYVQLLGAVRDRMAAEILNLEGRVNADNPFKKCYNEVSTLIEKATQE